MILVLSLVTVAVLGVSCNDWPHHGGGSPLSLTRKFPADVAIAWVNLQQDLTKSTPGFDPLVAARAFSYSGLALYESVVNGMPGHRSVMKHFTGGAFHDPWIKRPVFWPASANAAMAQILRQLYANTSAANLGRIDSLEASFDSLFSSHVKDKMLAESRTYGRNIADQVFEWSKTDGGHEAYKSPFDPSYTPPSGAGLWIPTPPAFAAPIRPTWGNNRSFVPGSAQATLPPPPPAYSESEPSDFHQAVKHVYDASQLLTEDDIAVIKTWGDLPGNYGTSSHYTHIATQLIVADKMKLDKAALTYAMHGIAIYEATICVFKAKYTYNLIRPVSFIRNVMGYATWSSTIGTPPHPEYPSAHATIGGASYVVLESMFGKNRSFTDRTHEDLFGARSYANLKEYALEAANSRFLGGLHYTFSADAGLVQGERVGELVLNIPFTGANDNP